MRVYLSRSNAAQPKLYDAVRRIIEDNGDTVVEFNGGQYDKNAILNCDVLLIVPPASVLQSRPRVTKSCQYDNYHVGKGQFDQVVHFAKSKGVGDNLDEKLEDVPVYAVTAIGSTLEEFWVCPVYSVDEQEEDWKEEYGTLGVDEDYEMTHDKFFNIDTKSYDDSTHSVETVSEIYTDNIMLGATAFFPDIKI